MKNFKELLKENNIKEPRTFLGRWLFEKKWCKIKEDYTQYCTKMLARNTKWEELRDELEFNWQVSFPALNELEESFSSFSFSNPEEAEISIFKATVKAGDYSALYKLQWRLDRKARADWIKEVISKADENCVLIVIKENYQPCDFYKKSFNECVKLRKPVSILDFTLNILWVAFNPHQEIDEIETWGMHKATSTVSYVH